MELRDKILKKAKEVDTTKYTAIQIRVKQSVRDDYKAWCKKHKVSQQATFEAILLYLMEEVDES